jgi:hypothetical protein
MKKLILFALLMSGIIGSIQAGTPGPQPFVVRDARPPVVPCTHCNN